MGYADASGPIALAHRGGGGLAPENTLAAFATATSHGLRYVETDVRLTADGHLVCFHDATVDRITEGRGPVARYRLADLRRLHVGGEQPVASLREALEAFPDTHFSVDLKDEACLAPLLALLRERRVAERLCVAGAWDGLLGQVRLAAPGVATSLGWRSLTALIACARTGVRPPRAIANAPFAHVPVRLGAVPIFVARVVDMAAELGIRIVTWTVDDPLEMGALLDLGVAAVITDRPDVVRDVFVSRGLEAALGPDARRHASRRDRRIGAVASSSRPRSRRR